MNKERNNYTAIEILTIAIDDGLGWNDKEIFISDDTIRYTMDDNNEQETYDDVIESLKEICSEYRICFVHYKDSGLKFIYELSDRIHEISKELKNR